MAEALRRRVGCRRVCFTCGRREVLSWWGEGRYQQEIWEEHTYPLDADPLLDPTPCGERGQSTVGFENLWDQTWAKINKP